MYINLSVAGRLIFAVPLLVFGLFHFLDPGMMVNQLIPEWLPLKIFFLYLTGGGLIAAAVCFILNWYSRLAGIFLALMLLSFIALLWLPQVMAGNQEATGVLLKDLGLLGGALMVAGQSQK